MPLSTPKYKNPFCQTLKKSFLISGCSLYVYPKRVGFSFCNNHDLQFRCLLLIFLAANKVFWSKKHICEKQNSALKSGINNKQTRYRILIEMSRCRNRNKNTLLKTTSLLEFSEFAFFLSVKREVEYYTHCLLFPMQNVGIIFFFCVFSLACLIKVLNVELETISKRQSRSQTNWRAVLRQKNRAREMITRAKRERAKNRSNVKPR